MRTLAICNKIIEYSFYALFFITPLVFTSVTSELFEFNKMWFVYAGTVVIVTSWLCKMILQRQILIQKTPLDIPIFLFLLSQIIATVISLDTHLSLWGYYSRFNGGLFSIISFILLYYGLVSNSDNKDQNPLIENPLFRTALGFLSVILFLSSSLIAGNAGSFSSFTFFTCIFFSFLAFLFSLPKTSVALRLILTGLFSGLLVTLWGLPSHFGYDPTCLLFRQSLDVACWTASFQPMVRIFSTLGQPNWLAAFLSVLIPISLTMAFLSLFGLNKTEKKHHESRIMYYVKNQKFIHTTYYTLLTTIFFIALLFTNSRSGFLGLTAGLFIFFGFLVFLFIKTKDIYIKKFLIFCVLLFTLSSLIFGTPFTPSLSSFSQKNSTSTKVAQTGTSLETGGTESGAIRLIVWKGALDVFKKNPLFGSGVETFAFSYYQNRPKEHNLTSEWDYLYNKAHNEYLNYLATTGIFGLGSYLLIIALFLFASFRYLISIIYDLKKNNKLSIIDNKSSVLVLALISSYVTILVSNFLGFSVVITNLYFFLIPAFVFLLQNSLKPSNVFEFSFGKKGEKLSFFTLAALAITILIGCYFLLTLFRFWIADTIYSYGSSLSKAGQYLLAQENLQNAVLIRTDEPVFQDDLAYNTAVLALIASSQGKASESAQLANTSIALSNNLIKNHPNYLTFLKTQVRLLYVLSQIDPKYLSLATTSIERAEMLAPTDAKVAYTAGVLYGQTGNLDKGITALEEAIKLKPDYSDAYFALALLYREKATNDKGQVVNPENEAKAVGYLHYILTHFDKEDKQALETLKAWNEQ